MATRLPRAVAHLLVAAVTATSWDRRLPGAAAVVRAHAPALLTGARRHRAVPPLWLALRHEPDLPADLHVALHDEWFQAAGTHLRALRDLALLTRTLDGAGIRSAVFKGPVLSGLLHPRPDLRPYVDLDVLVDGAALGTAVSALEEVGFRVLDRNWRRIRQLMLGEVHLEGPSGIPVDLHWQLLNRDHVRRAFRLSPTELLDRAVPVRIGGVEVCTFDSVDTVLHLAVHAAASGGDRLGWVRDVQLAAAQVTAWPDLLRRAAAAGSAVPTATMLVRAQQLGAQLPAAVPRELAGSAWVRVVRLAERLDPLARTDGGIAPTHVVGRSSRASARASFGALTGQLVSRRPGGGQPSVFSGPVDLVERERFFAAVAAFR